MCEPSTRSCGSTPTDCRRFHRGAGSRSYLAAVPDVGTIFGQHRSVRGKQNLVGGLYVVGFRRVDDPTETRFGIGNGNQLGPRHQIQHQAGRRHRVGERGRAQREMGGRHQNDGNGGCGRQSFHSAVGSAGVRWLAAVTAAVQVESQLGEASAATAAAIASMLEASRLAEIMEMTLS